MAVQRTFRLPHTRPAGGREWTTAQITENFRALAAGGEREGDRAVRLLALTTGDTWATGTGTHTLASVTVRSEEVRTSGGLRVRAAGNCPWFTIGNDFALYYGATPHAVFSASSASAGGESVGWWMDIIDLMNADGSTSAQWSQWGYKAEYETQACDQDTRNFPTTQEVTIALKAVHANSSDQSKCNLLMVELLPSLT